MQSFKHELHRYFRYERYLAVKLKRKVVTIISDRAMSGIAGSRLPDNCFGCPNRNLGSGTRNVALCEEMKHYYKTHKNVLFFSSFKCFSHLSPLS